MAAVLAGRVDGARVVERLVVVSEGYQPDTNNPRTGVACSNLIGCLGDDVPIAPDLARQAIRAALFGEITDGGEFSELCESVFGGRYFPILRDVVLTGLSGEEPFLAYGYALVRITDLESEGFSVSSALLNTIKTGVRSKSFEDKIVAAACLMNVTYGLSLRSDIGRSRIPASDMALLRGSLDYVVRERGKSSVQMPIALKWMQTWALGWGGPLVSKSAARITEARTAIFSDWISEDSADFQRKCCWAFGDLPIIGECYSPESNQSIKRFLLKEWRDREHGSSIPRGIVIAGFFFDFVWSREALAKCASNWSTTTSKVVLGELRL